MKKKILYGLLCLSIGLNAYYIQKKYVPRFAVIYRQTKSFLTGGEMTGPRDLTPEQVLTFYQMMKDSHEVLEAHKIPYVVLAGTLLGCVRHGGMIPWDDDIDLGVPLADEFRLQDIFPEFEKLGYTVKDTDFCYKIYAADPDTWKGETDLPPSVDIFIMRDRGDGGLVYSKWNARMTFSHAIPHDSFVNRTSLHFGEVTVYGPADPETTLNVSYPKGWKNVAYLTGDHLSHTKVDKTPFQLKKYEPAKPLGPLKDRYKK